MDKDGFPMRRDMGEAAFKEKISRDNGIQKCQSVFSRDDTCRSVPRSPT